MKKIIPFVLAFLFSPFAFSAATAVGTISEIKVMPEHQGFSIKIDDSNGGGDCQGPYSSPVFYFKTSDVMSDYLYDTALKAYIAGETVTAISTLCMRPFGAPDWVPNIHNKLTAITLK